MQDGSLVIDVIFGNDNELPDYDPEAEQIIEAALGDRAALQQFLQDAKCCGENTNLLFLDLIG